MVNLQASLLRLFSRHMVLLAFHLFSISWISVLTISIYHMDPLPIPIPILLDLHYMVGLQDLGQLMMFLLMVVVYKLETLHQNMLEVMLFGNVLSPSIHMIFFPHLFLHMDRHLFLHMVLDLVLGLLLILWW